MRRAHSILVTGGLGFIGSNFIRFVLSKYRDMKVTNVDKVATGASVSNLKDLPKGRRYRFVKGDIADQALVRRLLGDADCVVNFAAESHVDRSIADSMPFVRSNILGVYTLLEAIRKARRDVSLVQVGTDEEYGERLQGSSREDDRTNPSSPYAASKAAASMLVLGHHRTYGMDALITRCTNNFGPNQFPEKLIPKTVIRALLSMRVPVYGSGRQVRDWLYVEDHCEALDLTMRGGRPGSVYNVSSGTQVSNIDLVRQLLDILGKPHSLIRHVEDRPGHDIRYSLDSTRIRTELGWKPRHRFIDALSKTVDWYVANEWWWRPIADKSVLSPTPWKTRRW